MLDIMFSRWRLIKEKLNIESFEAQKVVDNRIEDSFETEEDMDGSQHSGRKNTDRSHR